MDLVRMRYLGGERVRVPKLGRVVEPDELVGVPADVVDRYAWPPSLWRREDDEPAPRPGRKTSPPAGGVSGGNEGGGDA